MRREVVESTGDGLAVVDTHQDIFMKPRFVAGVIKTEMRLTTVCHTIGTFSTRREATDAARAALSTGDRGAAR